MYIETGEIDEKGINGRIFKFRFIVGVDLNYSNRTDSLSSITERSGTGNIISCEPIISISGDDHFGIGEFIIEVLVDDKSRRNSQGNYDEQIARREINSLIRDLPGIVESKKILQK